MELKDFLWEEIKIGDTASFSKQWKQTDVEVFAELSGDHNPLHLDRMYAATTKFGAPIVHGMLIAALGSQLVGMYLPGKRCLLLKNEITFKKPVYIDDVITVSGIVETKSDSTKVLSIGLSFHNKTDLVAEGKMLTTVL